MLEKYEFDNAFSGMPKPVTPKTNITLHGYIIREMLGFPYVTSTFADINKWRKIECETELFWVISEHLCPLMETRYVLYKAKDIADEHLKELQNAVIN